MNWRGQKGDLIHACSLLEAKQILPGFSWSKSWKEERVEHRGRWVDDHFDWLTWFWCFDSEYCKKQEKPTPIDFSLAQCKGSLVRQVETWISYSLTIRFLKQLLWTISTVRTYLKGWLSHVVFEWYWILQ